jgi:thiol-disulfide isomerase/thioredoxin
MRRTKPQLLIVIACIFIAVAIVYIATHADSIPKPMMGAIPPPTKPPDPITFIPPTPLPTPTVTPDPVLDQPVMDFEFTRLDHLTLHVRDFKGYVLILNFWATWCEPCRAEMPLLQSVEEDYDSVRVLAVTSLDEAQTEADIRAFVEEFDLSIEVGIIDDLWVYQQYGVLGIPTTLIIDSHGTVRFRHMGELHEHDVATYLSLVGVE